MFRLLNPNYVAMRRLYYFRRSRYFDRSIIIVVSLFTGFIVALYPYDNLSLKLVLNPAVILVMLTTSLLAYAVIVWVMFISYVLDQRYDWYKKWSFRIVYQFLYGGVIPMIIIMAYEVTFYGMDMLQTESYYYILALHVFLLYIINARSYIIYLQDKRDQFIDHQQSCAERERNMEQNYDLLLKKYNLNKQLLDDLHRQRKVDAKSLEEYRDQIVNLRAELAEKNTILEKSLFAPPDIVSYVVKIGNVEKVFNEESILGFEIDGKKNRKPMIYLHSDKGQKLLTIETSLEQLRRTKFPHYLRITRKHLVSPNAILSYRLDPDEGCWVKTLLLEEELYLSKATWQKVAEKVRLILANKE